MPPERYDPPMSQIRRIVVLFCLLAWGPHAAAQTSFRVTLPDDAPEGGWTGRLVVYTIADDSGMGRADPSDGPFWRNPQPLFGVDVSGEPGGVVVEIPATTAFPNAYPFPPAELPTGGYRAQAVLDINRLESAWQREPGNRYGETVAFDAKPGEPTVVDLALGNTTEGFAFPQIEGAAEIVVESKLLSDFHGQPVQLRAGVVEPIDYDEDKKYAAVYEVPGFGGRHTGVLGQLRRTRGDAGELRRRAFRITLDPESPNGHTLFCDSAVNGPWARALIEELIPAIEAKYPSLVSEPWARIVTGHSSGGWSSLWLGSQYPKTFGATWSSAPDPVDFRRFELIDIYSDGNAYVKDGDEVPSCRYFNDAGEMEVTLSVRGENGGEGVLGPNNTSGQQWDSWMACWGTPRRSSTSTAFTTTKPQEGLPPTPWDSRPRQWPVAKPLFDAKTGELTHAEAEHYKRYDIRLLLANDPERYVPVFRNNIRLVCGTFDNYYLNEAVQLLKAELDAHPFDGESAGYVTMVEGADHGGSLFRSNAMRAWPREMIEHLDRHTDAKE